MSVESTERRSGGSTDVLVVDDEEDIRELFELSLLRMGLGVDAVGSIAEAMKLLGERRYRLCLTDMRLPDGAGIRIVEHIAKNLADLPVAVITAHGSMDNAVLALKAGAFDYLSKPVSLEQLRALVKSALTVKTPACEESRTDIQFTGESPAMLQVRATVEKLARSQAPVYVSGESGSGKERAARLIHTLGPRSGKAFVGVNCGAIPENLMESEFFGYRKGAFTGADSDRDGFFQAANGGTLFLDEVADLPLAMQVKLLRVIQERRVRRVGDTQELPIDVRIISATHQNLRERVEQGKFRQDLFYRLNVIELRMPALRERREDILNLANSILARLAGDDSARTPHLTERAIKVLQTYSFPGNVRELENIIERGVIFCRGHSLTVADLQMEPVPAAALPLSRDQMAEMPFREAKERAIQHFHSQYIRRLLEQHGGNISRAADAAGIQRQYLHRLIKEAGIETDEFKSK